jgi:ADP-heptose:LPS heptosyltransferase
MRLFEDLNATNLTMEKDHDYLIESNMVGAVAMGVDGNMEAEPIQVTRRHNASPNSIIVIRSGGAGDILFLTPGLRALRERHPHAHICVSCVPHHQWILAQSGLIDSHVDSPIKIRDLARYDWIVAMENTIEKCNDRHAVEIFAEQMHVELNDKSTVYRPVTNPMEFEKDLPKTKKRIAIQLVASSRVRTYPRVWELKNALLAAGWEVVICAAPGHLTFRGPIPNLINLGSLNWPWQKATDFLTTCDFAIGPDSSMIHFAGAMGIPGIGLYGSFLAKHRLIEGGSIEAIQATRECPHAPCFYHNGLGQLPADGPCNSAKVCTTLASISPEEILAKMAAMNFL